MESSINCSTLYIHIGLFNLQVSIGPGFDSSPCHFTLVMVKVTHDRQMTSTSKVAILLYAMVKAPL